MGGKLFVGRRSDENFSILARQRPGSWSAELQRLGRLTEQRMTTGAVVPEP